MAGTFLDEVLEDTQLAKQAKPQLIQPKKYKVILLNDDYTPMEFVVQILTSFFNHSQQKATEIMLEVHHKGKGICGVYTRDIAETKAAQVNAFAQSHEHPLLSEIEPE